MRKVDNLDVTAKLVLAVGAGAAIYLIAVPLAMLLFAAFRGPADYLPFEPGAHWTLEHVRALFTDPLIYTRILPDTFDLRRWHGRSSCSQSDWASHGWSSAPIFQDAKSGFRSSCFHCWCRRRFSPSPGSS